eukprot:COSAG01_NODE_2849_length_6977_cov_66.208200_4_plen_81_part_00
MSAFAVLSWVAADGPCCDRVVVRALQAAARGDERDLVRFSCRNMINSLALRARVFVVQGDAYDAWMTELDRVLSRVLREV